MVIVLEFRIPDFLHLTDTEESIRSLSDTQKMLKIIPLTLAVSFLALGPSMGEAASFATNLEKRGDIRLCGSMLVETLNVLCGGQYFDPNEGNSVRLNKRKDSSSWNDYRKPGENYPRWFALLLSSSSYNKMSGSQLSNRYQRGVVDECCRKSCTPSVLLSYCRL
ncbi:LIRP-like isoform X2 [Uloborus diversus]|uniref:LIRP-like isoform X2 n=1 Tax=Uloborus diversus TaxID=327109 RepID=UPI002409FB2F|nr:LIRP-like isoform X2 [Uloborus diversus]